ncbi:MAG: carboxypeptidase regulatory-like domain-containing protein [Candidatus Rokubacteria bacterium]|nr:carboxypeptidase regulatory-like domain-containing protein [Candidatus Rokubacteria bacterium]
MRGSLALAAIGLLLAVAGCQRAPEAPAPAPAVDHVAEARKALAVQGWAVAAPHLRAALQKDPESLFLHYNLGICASWLDLPEEAVREFEWVVAHAPGDSDEAKAARQWLADRRPARSPTAAEPAADDPALGDSGLRGTVMWAEPGQAPAPQGRQQLALAGLPDTPTAERIYIVRADRQGRYEFKRIVPGPYRLKGEGAGGRTRWRLKVVLEAGQDLELDLSPENGVPARDDFPESR